MGRLTARLARLEDRKPVRPVVVGQYPLPEFGNRNDIDEEELLQMAIEHYGRSDFGFMSFPHKDPTISEVCFEFIPDIAVWFENISRFTEVIGETDTAYLQRMAAYSDDELPTDIKRRIDAKNMEEDLKSLQASGTTGPT